MTSPARPAIPRVIGTAGHVDHGKSTLVRALTGIAPDRLAEEQRRGMTIDLGFAWLALPNGMTLGFVDVPGHRDFIGNMLAGVGGIDAALLVIDALEGVMPQTREHLAILDLLGVAHGIVALTKIDALDDPDWLAMVSDDVRAVLAGTTLAEAALIGVSAHTGAGMDALRAALAALVAGLPVRRESGLARLPIDRAFTLSGFGTIVTGTLLGGRLRAGEAVEVQPSDVMGRVRGLQSYQQPVEVALPGSRVAVNLAGVERRDVRRGDVLAHAGTLRPTVLVDAWLRLLWDASRPLRHNAEVRLFSGAAETNARVRLLDAETLVAGATGWVQFRLAAPLALADGDRFIIRYSSPAETIGGGIIVGAHPARRWRRGQAGVIAARTEQRDGTPGRRLTWLADGVEPLKKEALRQAAQLSADLFRQALDEALGAGWLVALPNGLYLSAASVRRLRDGLRDAVAAFHRTAPLRTGMPREHLRQQLGVKPATLSLFIALDETLVADGEQVRAADFAITFTPEQAAALATLETTLADAPLTLTAAADQIDEGLLRAALATGRLVLVAPDWVYSAAHYAQMQSAILKMLDTNASITVVQVRDQLGLSRKPVVALLEHLDALGITRRAGDVRVRAASAE